MDTTLDIEKLTHDELLLLTENLLDRLSPQDLLRIRDLVEVKRVNKIEDAKNAVIAEMKERLEALGLSLDEVMGRNHDQRTKRNKGSNSSAKYKSPNGETWSGRGKPPQWIRAIEEEGGNREEFRIPE